MELIDKAAVVAEIEEWRNGIVKCVFSIPLTGRDKADATFEYEILGKVIHLLNTLEVKEVNDAYKQGYNDVIDKACDAYCRLCDTKECGDTGECEWVEKFRKRLMR